MPMPSVIRKRTKALKARLPGDGRLLENRLFFASAGLSLTAVGKWSSKNSACVGG
jgi:hypothetical protein